MGMPQPTNVNAFTPPNNAFSAPVQQNWVNAPNHYMAPQQQPTPEATPPFAPQQQQSMNAGWEVIMPTPNPAAAAAATFPPPPPPQDAAQTAPIPPFYPLFEFEEQQQQLLPAEQEEPAVDNWGEILVEVEAEVQATYPTFPNLIEGIAPLETMDLEAIGGDVEMEDLSGEPDFSEFPDFGEPNVEMQEQSGEPDFDDLFDEQPSVEEQSGQTEFGEFGDFGDFGELNVEMKEQSGEPDFSEFEDLFGEQPSVEDQLLSNPELRAFLQDGEDGGSRGVQEKTPIDYGGSKWAPHLSFP